MRTAVGFLLLISSLVMATDKCPDFSGHYMIQGEDGQVHISIQQDRCERITIDRKANYLGKITPEKHSLKLDGVLRKDTSWFGARDKQITSARFVFGGIEVVARPASARKSSELLWKQLYELLPNNDLSIKEFRKRTQAYDSRTLAKRQK